MTHPDWDALLQGRISQEARNELADLMRQSPEALRDFRDHVLVDSMLAQVYAATRFACPDIETLGGIATGSLRASNEDLIHLGLCRACQEEIREIEQFHSELEAPEPESGWTHLAALGRRFLENLAPPRAVPLFAASDVVKSNLPAVTCEPLSQPVTFHVSGGVMHLEPCRPLQEALKVRVISESGESVLSFEGSGPFTINLEQVWEIHIGEK
ncbi:hypothetical protein SCOR_18285 [Sulfidibacter corallicola]|uniref:Uncharacterized protein n=1 Tax=Sulfidibacter corallicola TaxID=2818388 RepID=A0A8A4TUG6_SULCO|nr:hypothetical protein [Sulfidibacter corallicola]QTD53599.1 hypothetical protein J3U87_14180 [Sulfidibacter corallicola]